MLDKLCIMAYCRIQNAKESFADFLKKEKGSYIVEVVLIIGIVLVLAAVFWEQIGTFFTELIGDVFGKNPFGGTDPISPDDVTDYIIP